MTVHDPLIPTQEDLFHEEVLLLLPERFAINCKVLNNPVRQLASPEARELCRLRPFSVRQIVGYEATLSSGETLRIISAKTATQLNVDLVLLVPGALEPKEIALALERGEGRWVANATIDLNALDAAAKNLRLEAITSSWDDAFQLRESRPAKDERPATLGLRRPQIGALHASLAHLTRSCSPATIVMPTGTGKTETMLALNAHQRFERLLVVVPNDALREQIAGKFETFGVLRRQECLSSRADYPVVMRLCHIPTAVDEVDQIFGSANVVVTTMQIAGRADAQIQERMADHASALFIDEAHHIAAPTWARFRSLFVDRERPLPIFQFTATPFREDGRRVDGEFIYTYPLKKAQVEGYFKPIRFEAVFGLDQSEADEAIAEKLGEILQGDLNLGLNHLAMARCSTIERAKGLHQLYSWRFPQHNPVLVHSNQSARERRASLAALRRFDSRIIVCVDMLGEGFDLPELKIAGLHDPHKSVAVTIQFVGRFTRQDPRLGDATVIANTGVDDIDRSLAKLFAEDADWNTLVEALSSARIERQVRRAEMFRGFTGDLCDIPLQTLEPKMNAVAYRTTCEIWDPLQVEDLFPAGVYRGMKLNQQRRVAIFVTRNEEQAGWTSAQQATNVIWDLHMMHWDEDAGLLFISSSTKGPHDKLAKAICGDSSRRIEGEDVFRSLHGFKRLILRNLGLTHHQGRGVRYSMYMGVDVADGLNTAKQSRIKNNVFATGFLDGVPAIRGCSVKGKFWSITPVRDLTDWVDWCQGIGRLVSDSGITTDEVFKSAMRPRLISERPAAPPVAIHWPESLMTQIEERIEISFDGQVVPFAECDIELLSHERTGPLRFAVTSDAHAAEFEIEFNDGGARYPQRVGPEATIKIGSAVKTLSESFGDDAPQIDFGDGSLLIYSHLYALPDGVSVEPYPTDKIVEWDWSATNIRAESQGVEKRPDSVQRKVIEYLLSDGNVYDLIFDDDGKGEIADVVSLRVTDSLVQVTLYHCKFSGSDTPGSRLGDLYEVCGQAQKSARWRDRPNRMFTHMLKREKRRLEKGQGSRFELGTAASLKKLKASWQDYRYEFDVRIVQPGLSRAAVNEEGLHLLAGVETYLLETRAMKLRVIGSA
ncbi:DEAD/DEAH box helicase [Pseudomonas aeruginosa]|uniref:DEAD/DEAH box helicase n=1 Tax=Pseudomonas aeruginosa TaxID=287 RepID=UPI002E2AC4D8|nr:DEAD/DEAH box helicase family protein [Pseudomonas aeruginosa]HBN9513177.1 DEAD/DEAH box helicase family protein [Pseudomonas aeruginosa]HBN9783628.1 DEAD/DEAH box helicase family protein [Pseudomonas aeruginosa]HBN9853176.1 DEAD/DEAH box helicase family protein [Pseudomonas aeruginosa]HBN9866583.1 DEAD/DEAH box helicase family protein [Pseudomonas aeruginosa]HBN9898205.1 DEAD/DEAH box helicase family protein [Pseudomonas aeruginosa]